MAIQPKGAKMNRDDKPEDPFGGLKPVESELKEDRASDEVMQPASEQGPADFAAWLELELEKLEAHYQRFSTGNSRRKFFGR